VRLLFISLFAHCFDWGKQRFTPGKLQGNTWFYRSHPDAMTEEEIEQSLQLFMDRGLLEVHEVEGLQYYLLPTWDERQPIRDRAADLYPQLTQNTMSLPPVNPGFTPGKHGVSSCGEGERREEGSKSPPLENVGPEALHWQKGKATEMYPQLSQGTVSLPPVNPQETHRKPHVSSLEGERREEKRREEKEEESKSPLLDNVEPQSPHWKRGVVLKVSWEMYHRLMGEFNHRFIEQEFEKCDIWLVSNKLKSPKSDQRFWNWLHPSPERFKRGKTRQPKEVRDEFTV